MKTKMISARVDEQLELQIEYLKRSLGVKTRTQVLTEAVHHLYEDIKEKEAHKTPLELLEELQLIGCLEVEGSLSINYKKQLSDSLHKKHRSIKHKKQR